MKINITEKKQDNLVSFDKLPICTAFITRGGALCVKVCDEKYLNFEFIDSLRYSHRPTAMVEPVEIESIDVTIIRGGISCS